MSVYWMLPWALTCLLPAVVSSAIVTGSSGRAGRAHLRHSAAVVKGGSGDVDDPPPSCSCDCCETQPRQASEDFTEVKVKCGPSTVHSADVCSDQCSPGSQDKLIPDEITDSQHFCFFECRPDGGAKALEKTQCVAFTAEETVKLIDLAGNPIDPSFLYSPAQSARSFYTGLPGMPGASASLLSSRSKVARGGAPAETAIKGRAASETEGKDARKQAAILRESENLKQGELNQVLKQSGGGAVAMDPLAGIQDISSAAAGAKVSAERAAAIAAEAVKSYDQGRQKIWKMALSGAGKEVVNWKQNAEAKASEDLKARTAPTWQSQASEVAQKASKPYIDGLLRAQESAKLYNEKGTALASQATALWKESETEGDTANKMPRATAAQEKAAQAAMWDAMQKATAAQNDAVQSKQYLATAARVQKDIPTYQYNAERAADQAVAGMKTAF